MKKFFKDASCVLMLIIFSLSCAHIPRNDPTNPIRKVAVLPVVNNTPDMDGPELIRKGLTKIVMNRYYELPLTTQDIDQILRDQMGISLGGQLSLTTPQKLGEVLGVDGVVYADLNEFNYTITGFYNSKVVRARCKLVSTKTGNTVWEKEEKVSKSELALSTKAATEALKQNLESKMISKVIRRSPLEEEVNELIYNLYRTFPPGPVEIR